MASEARPTFVYKITPTAPPSPIPDEYPLSGLDQQDGFVHLSVGTQIPITAGLFFKDFQEIWVVKLRLARFAEQTNWDVPGCPHLYGNFGIQDVDSSQKFERPDGKEWGEILSASTWLE